MTMNDFEIENGTLVKYTGNDTHVVIPDSLTSIVILDGVTSVDHQGTIHES